MTPPYSALRDRELIELLRDEAELLAIADAIASTAPRRARRSRTVAALFAAIVCVAGVAVAPAFGIRFVPALDFWSAPAAPHSARLTFHARILATQGSDLDLRGLNVGQTRRIAVEEFRGETMRLFVAPLGGSGFCYEWALKPDDAGVWIDEFGACGIAGDPLTVSFDDTRVDLVADARLINRIALTLSNGQIVYPTVHWVSAPISAGFVLYQPPAHLHVVEAEGVRGDAVVASRPISDPSLFAGSG